MTRPAARAIHPSRRPTVARLVEQGQLAERRGHHADARVAFEQALDRLCHEPSDADITAAALLRWIARTHQAEGDSETALEVLGVARETAARASDHLGVAHADNLHATILLQQGSLDEAERLWMQARDDAVRANDAKLEAMTSQNLGVLANVRGDLPLALERYRAALSGFRALGMARDVCAALNNLGMLHTDLHQWSEAEKAYEEALQIAVVLGDLEMRVLVESNVAELCAACGAYDAALAACNRAQQIIAGMPDAPGAGEVEKVSGVVARERGDYAAAEAHFARAAVAAETRRNLLLAAETAREQAELLRRMGRNADMLQSLNHAHRLFTQLRAQRDLADVDRRTTRLENEFLDVVRRWGSSIESKDTYTQGHCERVADVACALAERAGLDGRALFWFRVGALLHDVGKLMVPADVLNKPARLTEDEWSLIRRHPEAGVDMLADIDFPWDVRPLVLSHHERWDGLGYPEGLAGEEIPFEARILGIADVYDALTSARSYKRAYTHQEALDIMRRDAGTQFDPALFALFDEMCAEAPPAQRAQQAATPPAPALPAADEESPELDDLTGLPLRRAIIDAGTTALRRSLAEGMPVSLIVIDVDHFKRVNDTFGHLQGDAVLRTVAATLRAEMEPTHVLGRYAGDEFVAVLPAADGAMAQVVAERMRAAIHALEIPRREGGEAVRVSLSLGLATSPTHGETFDALFAAADRALYAAKRVGRNAVAMASRVETAPASLALRVERFVGRTEEMRELARRLEEAVAGQPGVATIFGEAGVGKSTLLRQLTPEVRLRGGALVTGRAVEGDLKRPYGPLADVVAALHGLEMIPERPWTELPRLVPALERPPVPGTPPGGVATAGPFALLDEIVELLRSASATAPLVLLLDDMQWADAATWDALAHIQARLDRARVLMCLTIRSEDATPDVARRRRALVRETGYVEMALRRLDEEEMREWLTGIFHGDAVTESLLPFLMRQTEGNPFIVVQLLRALGEEGALRFSDGRWTWRPQDELALPVGITDLMARRLHRLSAEARRVLMTAAVIGRSFDVATLLAASGDAEDGVLDAVDEGVAAAVLEHGPGGSGDRYVFAHALLVDAMLRGTNTRRLARIHRSVARALESRVPRPVADLARHYEHAGDVDRAGTAAMEAGALAMTMFAFAEAAAFFRMAERLSPDLEIREEARALRAEALERGGRPGDAEAVYTALLAHRGLTTPASDPRLIALRRARERTRVQAGQPPARTLAALLPLLAEAEGADLTSERIALLTMIAQAYRETADLAAAETAARAALALAEQAGDARAHADALASLGAVVAVTEPARAIAIYRQAYDSFAARDDFRGEVQCHIATALAHLQGGDFRAAEGALLAAHALSVSCHAPDLTAAAALHLGELHGRVGRRGDAEQRLYEAQRLFSACQNEAGRLSALYHLAHLARDGGDDATAAERYQGAVDLARRIEQVDVEVGALGGLGLVAMQLGDVPRSASAQSEISRILAGQDDWWFAGRELAAALDVRLARVSGASDAEARFAGALTLAARHDPHRAAWLASACGGSTARW